MTLCQLNEPAASRAEQNVAMTRIGPAPFALTSRKLVKFTLVAHVDDKNVLPGSLSGSL